MEFILEAAEEESYDIETDSDLTDVEHITEADMMEDVEVATAGALHQALPFDLEDLEERIKELDGPLYQRLKMEVREHGGLFSFCARYYQADPQDYALVAYIQELEDELF